MGNPPEKEEPFCFIKPEFLQMTLSKTIDAAETNTLLHFRHPLQVQTPINIASFLRLSGTGMTSLIF